MVPQLFGEEGAWIMGPIPGSQYLPLWENTSSWARRSFARKEQIYNTGNSNLGNGHDKAGDGDGAERCESWPNSPPSSNLEVPPMHLCATVNIS